MFDYSLKPLWHKHFVVCRVYLSFLSDSSFPIVWPNSLELFGAFAVTILSSMVTPGPVYFAPIFTIVFASVPATVAFLPAKIPAFASITGAKQIAATILPLYTSL